MTGRQSGETRRGETHNADTEPAGPPTLSIDGGRATIRLQRPAKRNRIEPADLAALAEHLEAVEADPSVRVLVLAASGPSWCSGYHLGALAEGERAQVGFDQVCDRLEDLSVPTVAALSGSVHGGGTDLAVACDFRIGVEGMVLGMPAARIGIQYYASGLRRFVERIGADATKRLFLTAETVPGVELLRLGYLHELVEPDRLERRVDQLCEAIADLAPLAIAATKRAINELSRGGADLARIQGGHHETLRSHDHREALRALAEKRPARFEGR
jgi:enoyl-CoA hydratase/carnithine racemase